MQPSGSIFTDLTGRFPYRSSRGFEYIMCTRCSDSNYIHVEPLRSRTAREIVTAFEKSLKYLESSGIVHKKVKLDNETSNLFEDTIKALKLSVEYVSTDNHRQNPAERDIRTFKNHFIASLCTAHPEFPMNEWDLLLPQVEMTLNMMRGSQTKPDISAYEHLHGKYDYLRNPIGPIGTRVIIYEKPDDRGTWAPHGTKGFYIGPSMDHYRSFRIFVESTRRIRVTSSVAWHPENESTEQDEFTSPEIDNIT